MSQYTTTCEGIKINITYNYYKGTADYWTPSSGDIVNVLYWLVDEEDNERVQAMSEDERQDLFKAIDSYVFKDAEDDIIDYENDKG